jgi:hypothetical protein
MNYTRRLNSLIETSKLTQKEIAEGCEKLGENVTSSYINILKNNEGRIPSDNVSRAIAKTCGAQFEEILVVQAYLDKAPETIIKFFINYMNLLKNALLESLKINPNMEELNGISEEVIKEIFTEDNLAEFICSSQSMNIDMKSVIGTASDFIQQTRYKDNITEFRVSEDGKYLLVPLKENSTVRVIDEPRV